MKPLSAFFPRILPYVPACSEPLAAQALVSAAIELCEGAQVLREDLDPFYTVEDQIQYDLDTPSSQLVIARVMGVTLDDTVELKGVMAEDLRNLPQEKAKPRAFYTDRTGSTFTLMLGPRPDAVYKVVTHVALRPSRDATQLEDDLYSIWIDPLIAATLSKIMQVPNQPFTNFMMAEKYAKDAARGIAMSRIEGNYGLIRGSMRVRTRPFA